ncbi:MAG TPA: hypothetical protein DD642_06210 [Barnesiella sp.]|nr:hypothetical protein [Barnesiella sp.]
MIFATIITGKLCKENNIIQDKKIIFTAKIKKYKSLERFLLIDYKVIIKWIPIPIRHFFFFIIYTYKGQARFLCLSN